MLSTYLKITGLLIKAELPFYVKNIVTAFNSLQVNLVISINEGFTDELVNWLVQNSHLCSQ